MLDFSKEEIKKLVGNDKILKLKILKEKLYISFMLIFFILSLALVIFYVQILLYNLGIVDKTILSNNSNKENGVYIIKIDKLITSDYVSTIIKTAEKAIENKSKAIIFILNSSGGSPVASDELSAWINSKKEKIKIIGYIQDICASGCYYIASSMEKIYANQNSIIGSIGVILQKYNLENLAKKIGIEEDNITIGNYKQPLSLLKKIEEENKEYLNKNLLEPSYENFKNVIIKNRKIDKNNLTKDEIFEGKVFIANQPLALKYLVDEISTLTQIKENLIKEHGEGIEWIEYNYQENNFVKNLIKNSIKDTINTIIENNKETKTMF